ncbi:MAG: hypothetical protein HN348_05235 [Proteobacteria bacterium]|jgi:hypothetical protein|nr:hypothetical protein [Pseudomonadota bacterium]
MKLLTILVLTSLAVAQPVEQSPQQLPAVDHSDPVKVLQAVFSAAETGNLSQLPSLCHKKVDSDGDVRSICEMTRDDEDFRDFTKVFAGSTIQGPARIEGDQATVDFTFGPNGPERDEKMNLERHKDKWYLASF